MYRVQKFELSILIALVVTALPVDSTLGQTDFLSQNWDAVERQEYYTTSQGSRMMPYDWFMALETHDGQASFVEKTLPALGYLPNRTSPANPDGLPVGWVMDTDNSGQNHIGLNCAACHTNQVSFQGKTFQIDSRVAHPWGRARLDAFGMIFNRISAIDLGIPSNNRKPDAPVSYPFCGRSIGFAFFNTDCVSCHTETARRINLNLTQGNFAFRVNGQLPRIQAGRIPTRSWNVRNFGWFPPSFIIGGGDVRATVTQRTANETAEVVEFIERNFRSVQVASR